MLRTARCRIMKKRCAAMQAIYVTTTPWVHGTCGAGNLLKVKATLEGLLQQVRSAIPIRMMAKLIITWVYACNTRVNKKKPTKHFTKQYGTAPGRIADIFPSHKLI